MCQTAFWRPTPEPRSRPTVTADAAAPRPRVSALEEKQVICEVHRRVACFADSSAIPALFSLLQDWPDEVAGEIWIESDDVDAVEELTPPAQVTIRRVSTANAEGLLACARSIPGPADYVVWGAGERDSMKAIRSYFRTEVGLGKHDVAVFGYWEKGVSNTEIDEHRLRAYEAILARGGTLGDLDDAEIGI